MDFKSIVCHLLLKLPTELLTPLNLGQVQLIPGNKMKIRTRIYTSMAAGNLK